MLWIWNTIFGDARLPNSIISCHFSNYNPCRKFLKNGIKCVVSIKSEVEYYDNRQVYPRIPVEYFKSNRHETVRIFGEASLIWEANGISLN